MSSLLSLPDGLTEAAFAVLAATSLAGSFLTAALGIGGGTLVLAVMASLVPPAALIPVHGVVQLGSNAGRAAMMASFLHRPAVPGFVLGAVLGCVLGGSVAVELPPDAVRVGIGVFVIWSVLARPPAWLTRWPALAGGLSSVLTMFFGATGPFVASYVKAFDLPRQAHVATHAVLMTLQHGIKVVVFGLLGFAFGPWAGVTLALIATGLLGTWLGKRVLMRLPEAVFRTGLNAILLLLAARLLWDGLLA